MDEGIRGYCYVLPALFRRERSLMKELEGIIMLCLHYLGGSGV